MTYILRYKLIGFLVCIILLANRNETLAQWKDTYGNEWMIPGKPYLKVLVEKDGLQRIDIASLPSDFPAADLSKIQLWHRGKQVSATVTSTSILFYGEKNDGASDSLVYRPETARMNPNISLYSDKGAYFITTSDAAKRMNVKSYNAISKQSLAYQIQDDIYTFTNQFAFTTADIKAALNKSYYEAVNTWTGPTLVGVNTTIGAYKDTVSLQRFTLKNFKSDAGVAPTLEILFAGLNLSGHNVQVYVGKSNASNDLRKVGNVSFTGFDAKKGYFVLQPGDVNADGSGVLKVRSETSDASGDWYSIAYYKLSYPQSFDMTSVNSKVFNIPAGEDSKDLVKITGSKEGLLVYDITDRNDPIKLETRFADGSNEVIVDKIKSRKSVLFACYSSELTDIASANISSVSLKPVFPVQSNMVTAFIKPSDYDYLIVTNKTLASGATKYAEYRSSVVGGSHRVLVMDINDIYNQFNYGEPSPVGLKRFVNYMLKDGVRPGAHNLLLIGFSVSYPKFLVKELPNEIPTFGDPGADMLLVSGLHGDSPNNPAIPVGRINSFTVEEVNSYLEKVKQYEADIDEGWKKNILHLSGGHSQSEVNQLKGLLEDISPIVEEGEVGGRVKAYVKTNGGQTVEKVDIKDDVNNGVGMITFFGHGSQNVIDPDFGLISDATRGYTDSKKYTAMFFNGCGVGNIFTSRSRHSLSDDWLVSGNKGAIAVIANSYDSYVSSSSSFLKHLYLKLFGEETIYTVGEAVRQVALAIVKEGATEVEIANFQQSNLQGDPVVKLVRVSKPDFAVSDHSVILYSDNKNTTLENSKNPKLAVVLSNYGKFDVDQKPVARIRYGKKDGTSQTVDVAGIPVAYSDTLWVSLSNLKELTSISVKLDPQNLISELNESNNDAHLDIDWEIAKSQSIYSNELVKDDIAPQLTVKINQRRLTNEEVISPQPEIEIYLNDDRTMELNPDLISVYIKPCYDACDFVQVPSGLLEFRHGDGNEKELIVIYKGESLLEGKYELLVTGKDGSGNIVANSYQVKFDIDSKAEVLSLICYPNPASEYVKFQLRPGSSGPIRQIKWEIYNSNGTQIDKGDVSNPGSEVISWYWKPSVPDGIYIYKTIISTDTQSNEVTGKISLIR